MMGRMPRPEGHREPTNPLVERDPDPSEISTSYVERQNLTTRMEHAALRAADQRFLKEVREVALEHERPTLLLGRICEVLRGERVERTSVDRLFRLVGWARERAHEQTFHRLEQQLTEPVRRTLDGLLVARGAQSRRAWLRGAAD
jgi:hypothetical protein